MFVDFFFPDRCINCNLIIAANIFVCEVCMSQINFSTDAFEKENRVKEKCRSLFPTENAFALMDFQKEGLSREIIHSLKYSGRENIAEMLADWTIQRLQFVDKPDLIVSVPLHPKKQKKRGYNQLHLYTEKIAEHYKIPFDHTLIKRDKNSTSQAKKNKIGRGKKEHIFTLNKSVSGKHVLIIDDVLTTGNTMSAVAWEILKEKSNKISILIMANDV